MAVRKRTQSGITVRFPDAVRDSLMKVAKVEHRSAAAYIEHLVEADLRRRREEERAIRIYVAEDAPEWTGTVTPGGHETAADHTERTEVLKALFAG